MNPTYTSKDGTVQLYLGDCLEILPTLAPGSVDAVVTSPPYNCGKEYGDSGDSMDTKAYWDFIESIIQSAATALARHGYLCINHGNYIGSRETRQFVPDELKPLMERYLPFVDWIIWDKGPANGAAWGNFQTSPRIRSQHENIFVCGGVEQMPPSDINWSEWSKFTNSIWRIPTTDVDSSLHPAMMPVELAIRLCKLYSPQRGIIADPFTGSGTTGVACVKTGRRFIGIEKEPKYFDIAVRRIEKAFADDGLFNGEVA